MSHIKLHGVKPRIQYVANGTLSIYEFPFVIFSNTDIKVYLNDILQDTTTYSVSGVKNTNGGFIAFATPPTNGTIITITRELSIERTTDFQEGGALRANTLNDEFDYQTACLQQVADSINRSMILPPYATDTDVDLTLPSPSAGKAIVWNTEGTNLENSTIKINELEKTLHEYKEIAKNASIEATSAAQTATKKAAEATEQAQTAINKSNETIAILATKASTNMDNLTIEGKSQLMLLNTPNYGNQTTKDWNTEHIAEQTGLVTFISFCTSNALIFTQVNGVDLFKTTDNQGVGPGWTGGEHQGYFGGSFIVSAGDTYKVYGGTRHQQLNFYPFKGGQE